MRRKLSSMLLQGVITAAKTTMVIIASAVLAVPLSAQSATALNTASTEPRYPIDVAFTWDATLSNNVTSSRFWMQGAGAQIHGQFYRGFGAVADIAGTHTANINSTSVGLDMVTATFGPRYTWSHADRKFQFFAQGLVGVANGFNSIFPAPNAANTVQTSLAVKAGGGINIALAPHIALRAIEANWLRTQFSNSTTNVQNNLTLGAGIVFKFR